jgi:hypothetical protein
MIGRKHLMETLGFWLVMLAGSLLMLWYATTPILAGFFLLTRQCIKRFSTVQHVNALALCLTALFTIPLSWISMSVLYKLGRIDFP